MKIIKLFFSIAALLFIACENREEPVQFEITAQTVYSLPAGANTTSFAITGNITWEAVVADGSDWCSIAPTSANGDATVKISVTANADYSNVRSATIIVTAGAFSKKITIWQSQKPCPTFNAGRIASTGQTVFAGETPTTIFSQQNATGTESISYQWYKNWVAISGATDASYTPPPADAAVAGRTYLYSRSAKDDICYTWLTESEGSWWLTVRDCSFANAGTITSTGQTVFVGGTPATINSQQNASGGGIVSYQWYKNSEAISGATATSYTPPQTDAAATGTYIYTRSAKDELCNTSPIQSAGSWVLTIVEESYPPYSGGAAATWSCGAQLWSGALSNPVPGCESVSDLDQSGSNPAKYKNADNGYGYYYNWTCVNNTGSTLCPSPWRVPTQLDFSDLITCVGGDTPTGRTAMINAWGLPGYVDGSSIKGSSGFWSSVTAGSYVYLLFYYHACDPFCATYLTVGVAHQSTGQQVRCIL
jgi:uncharacterized protein (TIGR02145 family)